MTNRKRVSKNMVQSESEVLPVEKILSPFSLLLLTNLPCHIVPMVSSSCPWKLTCSLHLLHLLDALGPSSAAELHHTACEITGLCKVPRYLWGLLAFSFTASVLCCSENCCAVSVSWSFVKLVSTSCLYLCVIGGLINVH